MHFHRPLVLIIPQTIFSNLSTYFPPHFTFQTHFPFSPFVSVFYFYSTSTFYWNPTDGPLLIFWLPQILQFLKTSKKRLPSNMRMKMHSFFIALDNLIQSVKMIFFSVLAIFLTIPYFHYPLELSNILLCICTTFSVCIHQLMNIQSVTISWLL